MGPPEDPPGCRRSSASHPAGARVDCNFGLSSAVKPNSELLFSEHLCRYLAGDTRTQAGSRDSGCRSAKIIGLRTRHRSELRTLLDDDVCKKLGLSGPDHDTFVQHWKMPRRRRNQNGRYHFLVSGLTFFSFRPRQEMCGRRDIR